MPGTPVWTDVTGARGQEIEPIERGRRAGTRGTATRMAVTSRNGQRWRGSLGAALTLTRDDPSDDTPANSGDDTTFPVYLTVEKELRTGSVASSSAMSAAGASAWPVAAPA